MLLCMSDTEQEERGSVPWPEAPTVQGPFMRRRRARRVCGIDLCYEIVTCLCRDSTTSAGTRPPGRCRLPTPRPVRSGCAYRHVLFVGGREVWRREGEVSARQVGASPFLLLLSDPPPRGEGLGRMRNRTNEEKDRIVVVSVKKESLAGRYHPGGMRLARHGV